MRLSRGGPPVVAPNRDGLRPLAEGPPSYPPLAWMSGLALTLAEGHDVAGDDARGVFLRRKPWALHESWAQDPRHGTLHEGRAQDPRPLYVGYAS